MMIARRYWGIVYGSLFIGGLFLDQLTKKLALLYCHLPCQLTSFLSFNLTYNEGISFGLLSGNSLAAQVIRIGGGALLIGILIYRIFYRYIQAKFSIGEVLVCAGAVGNFIDRLRHGMVVDFIELSYKQWIWPSFNVADVLVVMGVLVMLKEYGDK